MNDLTINCPNCNIGMDIHMVEKPPVILEHFFTGYRDCPQCGYGIDVQIGAYEKGKSWGDQRADTV